MGYKQDWDKNRVWLDLSRMMAEVASPYNDGFTAAAIKKDLYAIKCMIDDRYSELPKFVDEDQWEQQRMIEILSRKSHGRV